MIEEWQTYCPTCQRVVLGRREVPNHLLHGILSLFLCFWAIVWLAIALTHIGTPYLCPYCGSAGVNR